MTEQPETDPEGKTLFSPPPELDTAAKTLIEQAPEAGALKAWGAAIAAQSEASPNNTLKTPSAQLGRASALALLMPRAVVNETGKPATLMAPADYTVARQLGRGGMGVVYAARQESLSREVALKVLAPEVTSEHFEERFATEARLAGRLEHPNIVPVYELGRSAEGRLYLAMKLVRGEAFSAVLKRGDVPLRRLLEILMAIADALAFAHSRNVIHRDLKPDNVMIGEFGEVQVMDWGLAIDLTEPRERGHAGTPAYMSPEQADGDPQTLGAWSDVYLLGAMLYEVLTGTPPHRGDGVLQVLLAAAKGEVQKPCDRAPARKIPGDLEALCLAALEKETEKRLPSAQAFKAGIATHLAHTDALGLLDKARALIDAPDDDADAEAERLRKAETFLEQAQALWPESELARSLHVRVRALQAELALDRGEGRKAAAIVKELVPTEGVSQERIEQLTLAARRQVNRLRNQVVAAVIVAVAMVLGHRGISQLTEERAREHARRDARLALAARTGDAWRALAREEGREVVNESLAKLAATREESGWEAAETDEPLVAAFATWQALGTGAERRAIELLPKAGWRQELEAVWTGDPLVAADAWRVGASKAGVPGELERAAEACLVAGLARSLPAARLREQAGAIKERLDQLGARAVLADARSGAPEAIVSDLPVRVALEKGQPGAGGRKELDRVLVAHDAASGRELWRFPPPLDGTISAPRSPLVLAPHPGPPPASRGEGALVVVAWGTDVLALDPLTGVVRSRARTLDEVAGLLPAPDGRVLAAQRATAGHARSRLVPCEPGKVLAPVIPGASVTALSFEASSARVWVGEPRAERPAAADVEAALARLALARGRDPTNAAWDLEEAKLVELAGRHDDARAALERFGRGDLSAWELAVAAQWANDHGLADAGEKLLERAVLRAAALGHDADASPALLGNAGFAARRAAESAAKKGDTESMLRELALARELATVVEGDRTLVPLERDWLRAGGRERELEALRPYEHPARVAGGTLSMPEGLVELFDVG
ncbi:MAG TPA: serine/threonine-protein kinase, partial [Planctomycetota bacterium]|nr:serine/threonine-protein kinase [Planctomycetota bacterium]